MAADKYQQLVERLASKTDQREVVWKEAAGSDTFQVSFANYSLTLSVSQNRQGALFYVISILNSEGNTVDSFSDEDIDEGTGGRYFNVMGELYHKARRQALGVDKALDEILEELKDPF
jgi:hypothetical protein